MTFPISAEKECAPVAHVSAYVIVFQCVTLWWKTPPKHMWVRCATVVMSPLFLLASPYVLRRACMHACEIVRVTQEALPHLSYSLPPADIAHFLLSPLVHSLCVSSFRVQSGDLFSYLVFFFFISPHGEAKGHQLLWHIYVSPWLSSLCSLSPSHCFFFIGLSFPFCTGVQLACLSVSVVSSLNGCPPLGW